jgi:hypothetical protein
MIVLDELDGPELSAVRRAIAEVKQHWSVVGWVTQNLLSQAPPCFGMHVKQLALLHLQSLTPTNPHWAGVVGYGPFSLCVILKEGLCPSSGDIDRLMMMIVFITNGRLAGKKDLSSKNLNSMLMLQI